MKKRPEQIDKFRERAIEIYEFSLKQSKRFRARDIEGWRDNSLNKEAIAMLVSRDLLRVIDMKPVRTFKVSRIVDPSTCLDVASDSTLDTGVTRYRVHPSIAAQYATSSNLQQYAIN